MSTHETHNELGAQMPHGSRETYIKGFILSVILTAIPFALVMSGGIGSAQATGIIVLGCAIVQILVHMVYFLHLSPNAQKGWVLTALVFTIIVLVIAIIGTMWVMYNMDALMMPSMAGSSGG